MPEKINEIQDQFKNLGLIKKLAPKFSLNCTKTFLFTWDNQLLNIYNIEFLKLILTFMFPKSIKAVSLLGKTNILAILTPANTLEIWDIKDKSKIYTKQYSEDCQDIQFSKCTTKKIIFNF